METQTKLCYFQQEHSNQLRFQLFYKSQVLAINQKVVLLNKKDYVYLLVFRIIDYDPGFAIEILGGLGSRVETYSQLITADVIK